MRSNKDADGLIMGYFQFNGKQYVMTKTATYRVKIRKRWRDKNKPPLADLIRQKETQSKNERNL